MIKQLKDLPLASYIIGPKPGQQMVLPKPNNVIGFIIYQSDQQWGYSAFGGQGKGDALYLVSGRFEYAGIRTTPDVSASAYDLKNNPSPTMWTGAFTGDEAALWVNTEKKATAPSDGAAKAYKNPYDINMSANEKTLFFAALTPDFKPEMMPDIFDTVTEALVEAGLIIEPPLLFSNTSNQKTVVVAI